MKPPPATGNVPPATVLLREIETYRSHGLFVEADKKARALADLILQSKRIKDKEKHLAAVVRKINQIEKEAQAFEAMGASVQLSVSERDRIKKVFASAFEEGSEAAVHEAAIAMLVFGQFKEAAVEFNRLIKSDAYRVGAAKNIIRCYLGLSSMKGAVNQYRKWFSAGAFPPAHLEDVRYFLQGILKKKGIAHVLERPKEPEPAPKAVPAAPAPTALDIFSVDIPYPDKFGKEKRILLDVHFQRGPMLSLIVPGKSQDLVDYLQPGRTLAGIQFNSTDVIFIDSGVVHGKSLIRVGEKRGDYTVTVKIGGK